jgi:hypothetical protein
MPRPQPTRIYHITHVENLSSIIGDGGLLSDAEMIARGGPQVAVGMSEIKRRRLELALKCHAGDKVGEYVPFFFCPRSVMLYILYMGNRPGLTYLDGQGPIVHLEVDVKRTIEWAAVAGVRWAFTNGNAATAYTPFFCAEGDFEKVNWEAVAADDFRDSRVREGKEAEFLVKQLVPWELVERVGAHSEKVAEEAAVAVGAGDHRPSVEVCRGWYFP